MLRGCPGIERPCHRLETTGKENLEPFSCQDECAGEASLYEELGVDLGATEKEIKQAFRKLSLSHHPDKTRNDPATRRLAFNLRRVPVSVFISILFSR